MSIPIYKSYLKSLREKSDEVLLKEQVEKSIQKQVSFVVKKVLETAEYTDKKCFVYKEGLVTTVYLKKMNGEVGTYFFDIKKDIISDIIENLKTKLPDCDISTDPLNTYIYISWE